MHASTYMHAMIFLHDYHILTISYLTHDRKWEILHIETTAYFIITIRSCLIYLLFCTINNIYTIFLCTKRKFIILLFNSFLQSVDWSPGKDRWPLHINIYYIYITRKKHASEKLCGFSYSTRILFACDKWPALMLWGTQTPGPQGDMNTTNAQLPRQKWLERPVTVPGGEGVGVMGGWATLDLTDA